MSKPSFVTTGIGLAFAMVGVLALSAPCVSAQSLAEVAKKEQKRRHAMPIEGARKTYTEADLPSSRTQSSGSSSTALGTGDSSSSSINSTGTKGEDYWRQRFKDARAKVAAADARVKMWERSGGMERSPSSVGNELQAAHAALDAAKAELKSLEDEATKNGVPQEWTR